MFSRKEERDVLSVASIEENFFRGCFKLIMAPGDAQHLKYNGMVYLPDIQLVLTPANRSQEGRRE